MGSIHINPANKGKFNATKKATGKTTEELTHSKNPLTRKRAIFAQNAKKWHHADGGVVIKKDSRNNNTQQDKTRIKSPNIYLKQKNIPKTPENWEKEIRNVEQEIGHPSTWTIKEYNKLQNKLNEYKYWRENTPEGKTVIDYHNEPNEYVVPLPKHLSKMSKGGYMYEEGGINNPGFRALPDYVQEKIMANMETGGYMYPIGGGLMNDPMYAEGGKLPKEVLMPRLQAHMSPTEVEEYLDEYGSGGYVVKRSSERKGKTHVVIGPDGTKKYFGDSKLGQHPDDPARKKAFYARHKHNLANNPYFRAFARKTWADGGEILPKYEDAGWLAKNKSGVGAGLGFVGDTTNLLFDNNVFGTHNQVTDSEGNILGEAQSDAASQTQGALSGALKGASAGAVLGPWGMAGGALIGGAVGLLSADTGAEDKLNQIKRERNAQISFKNMLGKGPIANNLTQTNNQSYYAGGGMKTLNQDHPEATEEVELGESAMLPNGANVAFGGEKHENGGLETNLPEGTRIFSDRIKSGKRTIASIAKPIQNKIEKLKDNNSKAALNTTKLFEKQLDNLFNEQEEIKQVEDMKQRKIFAKGGMVKYGGEDGRPGVIPIKPRKMGLIQPRELGNILPIDTTGIKMNNPINNGELFNLNQVKKDINNTYLKSDNNSDFNFNKGDIGTVGALGTSLIGNLIQRNNINKVAPPRTLIAPTFTAGKIPNKVDYSADLQSADNQFNAAKRGVMMNSGNYSTQAGNLGQLRAEQLRNRSKILQNQNNTNIGLMNEYQDKQADAINKNALSNYTTDQSNMENLYNYNLWKTGQTNAADANATNTSGQVFNNMITGQNQLDAAEMYRRMYAQKVRDDLAFKAMGGTVRNYFAKGGTVYSQKLQEQINQPTINNAAAMDAEYASYLDAKGQPLQDTFKSKVTGLEYKVLPRKEKDLYAANLWKEAHGSAPTKKQVAATTKAIEGKKTSSPGAKTVAQMMSDKFSVSDQEANLVNAVNADREDTMSYLPKKEKAPTYKGSELKRQGAQLLDAVGSLGFTAIGNPLYQFTGTDLGFGHTDLSDEAVDKKLKNPYEYTTAAENAMIGIMGGKALSKLGGYMLPKASKIINAAARTEELAATKLSDKAFKSSRTKFSNKQSKNWVENGGRQRKLDMESTPEFLNKKRNSILEQEDEAFIQSKNNKKLEDKLNFAENELDNTVIKAKEKKSNIAIKSLETRMKNAKKAGDVDKFNSLKSKYLKLMEMEQ